MGSLKRAKWIEGITDSNRILRDIAEIATSAIRNESGIIEEENWELVFPRPFHEESARRTRLVQVDPVANTRIYKPIKDQEELTALSGIETFTITNPRVIASTLVVEAKDGSATYVKGIDYNYDEETQVITKIDTGAGGTIPDGKNLKIKYSCDFNKILDSIPVKIEKQLTLAQPDREINPFEYIFPDDKSVRFLNPPPTDALWLALTYTELTGIYARTRHEKIELEKDTLDTSGKTFKLPSTLNAMANWPLDKRTIASTTGGNIGTGGGGTVQYTITDPIARKITFATAPIIANDGSQRLMFQGQQYTTSTETNQIYAELTPDPDDATGITFIVTGTPNEIDEMQPHAIFLETDVEAPQFFKHLDPTSAGLEVIDNDRFTVKFDAGEIELDQIYTEELFVTFVAREDFDLEEGYNKVTDRIVLRTTTVPENEVESVIGRNFGAVDDTTSLTMYVEMRKPAKLIHPETGLERWEDHTGIYHPTGGNNHYILTRMFDKWDDEKQEPQKTTFTLTGDVDVRGAYISDWSKYAWYKDWEEVLVDEVDSDPGIEFVADGVTLKPVNTKGMTDEFPIQFWITTNNNRMAIVLMGDPTLDQENFLASFGYFGRIHPFYDSECIIKKDVEGNILYDTDGVTPLIEEKRTFFENDVQGNFALTVGSSTIPASVGVPTEGVAILEAVTLNAEVGTGNLVGGELYDKTSYAYMVTFLTSSGESKPTPIDAGRVTVPAGTVSGNTVDPATVGISVKLRFSLPSEATGYRIYRYHEANSTTFSNALANDYNNFKRIISVDSIGHSRTIEFVDDGKGLPMNDGADVPTVYQNSNHSFYSVYPASIPTARAFEAITRDKFTGTILNVKFTDSYGINTATGVSDIAMYRTRSGLKYQRHQAAFITTEEFMRKEKSGQSRWTGKFHLSPIYIEHSYDKQRGWLDGVMAVDDSGIEHLDELIVDKGTPTEEIYKFFRINAPYSMFNNSPNFAYGVALIKQSMRWQ